jgi:hypothetical protein
MIKKPSALAPTEQLARPHPLDALEIVEKERTRAQ